MFEFFNPYSIVDDWSSFFSDEEQADNEKVEVASANKAVSPLITRTHFIPQRLLQEAHGRLLERYQDESTSFMEEFIWVAGYATDEGGAVLVWDHLVELDYSLQSAGGVTVDANGVYKAITQIREVDGMYLVGHLHSHPGWGRWANTPSCTDCEFVESLALGRNTSLGGIFSRGRTACESFVRFFASPLTPYEVKLIGQPIKEIPHDTNNYHLKVRSQTTSIDPLAHQIYLHPGQWI